jgi:hypothetical protein
MKNSSRKKSKRKVEEKTLSDREIEFAKLVYEDKLRDEEIAVQCGIATSTVYLWKKKARILKLIDQLGEADTRKAKLILMHGSVRAAKSLVLLTASKKDFTKNPEYEFNYNEETVRKAADDILQGIDVNVKGKEGETTDLSDLLGVVTNSDIKQRAEKIAKRAVRKS